jgi:hypothetical protein
MPMHRNDFYELLTERPFRPFRMKLSLNVDLEVRHPELAILEYSVVRIEAPSQSGESSEKAIIVSLAHIVTVEYLPAKTS